LSGTQSKIWSVDQKGLKFSFLIGSIHVPHQLFPTLCNHSLELVSKVRTVVTETTLDAQPDAFLSCPNWANLLSDKKREKWQRLMNQWNVPPLSLWYSLPPIALLNFMQVKALSEDAQGTVLDEWIYEQGIKANKETDGLLSPEEHYGLLLKIPLEHQLNMLKKFFKNPGDARRKARRMLELYRGNDMHALYSYTNRHLGEYRSLLLRDRNKKMAVRARELMHQKSCVFVVGAAHLAGEHGLIHLLKSQYGMQLRPWPSV